MKKQILGILVGSLLATVGTSNALAVVIRDVTNSEYEWLGPGESESGTWSYAAFNPALVTSIDTIFTFWDNDNYSESFGFTVSGATRFSTAYSVNINGTDPVSFVLASGQPGVADWSSLLTDAADGSLGYTVTLNNTSNPDNVYFMTARVIVNAREEQEQGQTPPTGVPDGGASVALLGLGLLGIVGVKRGIRS